MPQQKIVMPSDIKPLPSAGKLRVEVRKRRSLQAEILTSSPVKNELRARPCKPTKKTASTGRKQAKKTKVEKMTMAQEPQPSTSKTFHCLVCSEPYADPPEEDWIQCFSCKGWAHDDCTDYRGHGDFICDHC